MQNGNDGADFRIDNHVVEQAESTSVGPKFIITLVHGTYATQAPWTRKGSKIFVSLENAFRQNAVIKHFDWSGGNSIVDRIEATESLAKQLIEDNKIYCGASHIIVAHSHGGNVAVHVAEEADEPIPILAIVCIGTPFLSAGLRDLSFLTTKVISDAILSIVYLFLVILSMFLSFNIITIFVVVTISVVMCNLIAKYIDLQLSFVKNIATTIVDDINFFLSEDIRYLIIRKSGDEATPALGASQLLSWASSKFFYDLSTKYRLTRLKMWPDVFRPLYITLPILFGAILIVYDNLQTKFLLPPYSTEYTMLSSMLKSILIVTVPCFLAYKFKIIGRYTLGGASFC